MAAFCKTGSSGDSVRLHERNKPKKKRKWRPAFTVLHSCYSEHEGVQMQEKKVEQRKRNMKHNQVHLKLHSNISCKINPKALHKNLQKLHCHFNWRLPSCKRYEEQIAPVIENLENDCYMLKDTLKQRSWQDFFRNSLLAYLYASIGNANYSKAGVYIDAAKHIANGDGPDALWYCPLSWRHLCEGTKCGMTYVLDSLRSFLLFRCQKYEQVSRILCRMDQYEDLSAESKALILTLKTACLVEFARSSPLRIFQKAASIDPKFPEWNYMVGISLAQIRYSKEKHSDPSDEEIEALEKAVQLAECNANATHLLALSQALRDKARYIFVTSDYHYTRESQVLIERGAQLTQQALRLSPNCPEVNTKCGESFMKLPYPYCNVNRAKKCFETAIKLSPNDAIVNYKAGIFFSKYNEPRPTDPRPWHEKVWDYEKARGLFFKAVECSGSHGNFPAEMSVLDMELAAWRNFDPHPGLDQIMHKYGSQNHSQNAIAMLMFKGCYYWLFKRDLTQATTTWLEAMKLNDTNFKNSFMRFHYFESLRSRVDATHYKTLLKHLNKMKKSRSKEDIKSMLQIVQKSKERFALHMAKRARLVSEHQNEMKELNSPSTKSQVTVVVRRTTKNGQHQGQPMLRPKIQKVLQGAAHMLQGVTLRSGINPQSKILKPLGPTSWN